MSLSYNTLVRFAYVVSKGGYAHPAVVPCFCAIDERGGVYVSVAVRNAASACVRKGSDAALDDAALGASVQRVCEAVARGLPLTSLPLYCAAGWQAVEAALRAVETVPESP